MAWNEFKRGKLKKTDVQNFNLFLENNIFQLHYELKNKTYQHSNYISFYIKDPKLRHIHKATVKDRVLHHAIFRILYPLFDKTFVFDSYSCRNDKGVHRAIVRFQKFARKVSKNNTKTCFVLKCDIKKFFDNIPHEILLDIIKKKILDKDTIWLIENIIKSFEKTPQTGLPLGNVTSQLFANIYLGELDKFIKHELRPKYYIRYCDDFVILDKDEKKLKNFIFEINHFLKFNLKLSLHPDKIEIRIYNQGIDFLGSIIFPCHKIVRTKTKKRIIKNIQARTKKFKEGKISKDSFNQTIQSYFGLLKHCNSYEFRKRLCKIINQK